MGKAIIKYVLAAAVGAGVAFTGVRHRAGDDVPVESLAPSGTRLSEVILPEFEVRGKKLPEALAMLSKATGVGIRLEDEFNYYSRREYTFRLRNVDGATVLHLMLGGTALSGEVIDGRVVVSDIAGLARAGVVKVYDVGKLLDRIERQDKMERKANWPDSIRMTRREIREEIVRLVMLMVPETGWGSSYLGSVRSVRDYIIVDHLPGTHRRFKAILEALQEAY